MAKQNYTLGRGKLYFAPFKPGTEEPMGRRYLGNTPEFNISVESEDLDHYNSDEGVREKDASVAVQTDRSATITTDNISPKNIALFFLGSASVLTQASATGVSNTFADVEPGLSYQLGRSAANPAGVRGVTNVVVASGATTYILNTDYTVEPDVGMVTVAEGGAIPAGSSITVTYNVTASSRDRVISGSSAIEGELVYIAKNPAGANADYLMQKVRLSPSGDFTLKADSDWQALSFAVAILKKSGGQAVYADGRPYVA